MQAKSIYGFDILKFVMALMIIAIHSAGSFMKYKLGFFLEPFIASAVPTFFVLSAYFLFKKLRTNNFAFHEVLTFVKRIGIMYGFWFIVNIPVVLKKEIIYELIFRIYPAELSEPLIAWGYTVIISILIATAILWLSKRNSFHFLKYAY